nr:MAG TPA: hypothetical protein [Caudoviricetes sp.]
MLVSSFIISILYLIIITPCLTFLLSSIYYTLLKSNKKVLKIE